MDNFWRAFGERLRSIIEQEFENHVEQASEVFGKSSKMVYKYLRGEAAPNLETISLFARRTGYSLSWLIHGEGPEKLFESHSEFAEGLVRFSRRFADELGCDPSNLFDLRVQDNGLAPVLEVGDLAIIDQSKTELFDGYYLIRIGSRHGLRRVMLRLEGDFSVSSGDANSEICTSLSVIGRVVSRIKR